MSQERAYSAQDYLAEGFTGGDYPVREFSPRVGAVPEYDAEQYEYEDERAVRASAVVTAPSRIYSPPPERPPSSPTGYVHPAAVPSTGSRVRPYARTGGRTRSAHDLALEALVSTSEDGRRYRGVRSVEHRRICDLCLDTRSVAEIAAYLVLPLGVVKVLVGDMADAGLVLIHQTELILGDRSSREFMERVLQGLRAL
ncbi:DUF742 domain-containing protein [Amycolatopsis sp. H20-H5]|uniref:DUF742 domain-containing protein n=1 Tax=Amycolatopsis sp. H20-H5 TaxID=3046309 RepID=UPI003FA3DAF3